MSAQDRRQATRVPPDRTPWPAAALLRPGLEVRVINVSCGGALVESANRLKPGARAELQLSGSKRQIVRGRIDRCRVMDLDPIRYEGAIVFDQLLEWA
jgi:hypothetical protein